MVIDLLPIWGVFLATTVVVAISMEVGFRLGLYRQTHADPEKETSVSGMVGATIGLLAFMLTFTFGMAASRFNERRYVVLDEANAIGTCYLRAGLLPEPEQSEIRNLLREYLTVRLKAVEPGNLDQALRQSDAIHAKLWLQAGGVSAKDPHSIVAGLFIQSLNAVIDIHAKRLLLGVRNRIPGVIWAALYFVTIISMGAMGYHDGLTSKRRSPAVFALILCFAAVTILIVDLDRPQEGILRVGQEAMNDLRTTMAPPIDQAPKETAP